MICRSTPAASSSTAHCSLSAVELRLISALLTAPRRSRVSFPSLQMSTTFTGMTPKEKEGVRAAANLPLWKNVLFSAIGGVVGACTQRSFVTVWDLPQIASPAADNGRNSRGMFACLVTPH
jgi:hypothetical protein